MMLRFGGLRMVPACLVICLTVTTSYARNGKEMSGQRVGDVLIDKNGEMQVLIPLRSLNFTGVIDEQNPIDSLADKTRGGYHLKKEKVVLTPKKFSLSTIIDEQNPIDSLADKTRGSFGAPLGLETQPEAAAPVADTPVADTPVAAAPVAPSTSPALGYVQRAADGTLQVVIRLDALGNTSVAAGLSAGSRGWLQRASGGRVSTPKPIQSVAPNGVSMRVKESESTVWGDMGGEQAAPVNKYSVDPNSGKVRRRTYRNGKLISTGYDKASLVQRNNRLYWKYNGRLYTSNRSMSQVIKAGSSPSSRTSSNRYNTNFSTGRTQNYTNSNPSSRQPTNNYPQNQSNNQGAQIATGILQLIQAASRGEEISDEQFDELVEIDALMSLSDGQRGDDDDAAGENGESLHQPSGDRVGHIIRDASGKLVFVMPLGD